MKTGAHTNGTKSHVRSRLRVVLSACLATVLLCAIGGFFFIRESGPQQEPPVATESIAADGQQASSEDQSQPDETRSDEDIARDIELGYVHDELVLSFDPGTSADSINRTLASYDFAATKDVSDQDLDNGFVKVALVDGATVEDSVATLKASGLAAQPNYLYEIAEGDLPVEAEAGALTNIEPNAAVTINDPDRGNQWALDSLDAYKAWGIAKAGETAEGTARANRVSVAVIDTGCTIGHIDLKDNILASYNAKTNQTGTAAVADTNSHGTHVAGIVSARTNNGVGVAGVSYNAGLVIINATNGGTGADRHSFASTTLAQAYTWLFRQSTEDSSKTNAEYYNVRVINMSLGGKHSANFVDDDILTTKIKQARNGVWIDSNRNETHHDSILTVTAAGNAGTDAPVPFVDYPGDHESCLTVINLEQNYGWTTTNNVVGRYTDSNYNVDNTHIKNISAPGTKIRSTLNSAGSYGSKSGTSMAAPYVSGIASLLFTENPALTADQVIDLIYATATDVDAPGWDRETGYGEINAYHVLQVVSAQLGGSENIEYKNRQAVAIEYGDGTGWETYGSTEQWEWSIDNSDTIEMTVDSDTQSVSLVGQKPGSATVTATFKGVDGNPIEGVSISKTYTVMPLDISKATVTVPGEHAYTGHEVEPKPLVSMSGTELIEGVDYTVSYSNNVEIGQATVTITGIGNAAGTASGTFAIGKADIFPATLSSIAPLPYTGEAHEPTPTVTLAGFGALVEGTDFTYEYEDNVNAGSGKVHVVGMGNFKGSSGWLLFDITPIDVAGATIGDIPDAAYTGSAIAPEPGVIINGKTLVKDTDYTLSYANNVNAGTASITVTGTGNYSGTQTKNFTIAPLDISAATVSGVEGPYAFNGIEIKPTVTVTLDGKTLGADAYDIAYADNLNAGTARITITGKGNYTGTITKTFDITPIRLEDATIEPIGEQPWRGGAVTPVPVIKAGDIELVVNRDFTVTYSDNTGIGTATAIITGKGNCTGTVTLTFTIVMVILPEMVSAIPDQPYTGSAIEPGITVASTGVTLVRNENYSVEFSNNVNAGTATVTIKGLKGIQGEVTTNFKITPVNLAYAAIGPVDSYTYTGNAATPTPYVYLYGFGDLEANRDFVYEYQGNVDAGTAQLRVVGKGNFTGATDWRDCSFTINRKDISSATVSIASQPYTGKAVTPDPTVKIDGKTLVKGTDYRVSYYNNLYTGDATAVIEGRGNYRGSKEARFEITSSLASCSVSVSSVTYSGAAQTPAVTVRDNGNVLKEGTDYAIEGYSNNVNAGTGTVTLAGKGKYAGKTTGSFSIRPRSLADATVSIAAQTHTGSALTPSPTVTLGSFGELVEGRDYTLSYANNVNVGTANVTITGTGNYAGTTTANFAITESASKPSESDASVSMQRLYNPHSGEHFYTASAAERDMLVNAGWNYEGSGWTAPERSNTPVYRLYNANAGDHHYTTSTVERDALLAAGWADEGIGWYSDDQQRVPLYRQYNPNAAAGSHNYTTSIDEHWQLVGIGWQDEGISWYGL